MITEKTIQMEKIINQLNGIIEKARDYSINISCIYYIDNDLNDLLDFVNEYGSVNGFKSSKSSVFGEIIFHIEWNGYDIYIIKSPLVNEATFYVDFKETKKIEFK